MPGQPFGVGRANARSVRKIATKVVGEGASDRANSFGMFLAINGHAGGSNIDQFGHQGGIDR